MRPVVAERVLDGAARRRLRELVDVDLDLVVGDFADPRAQAALAGVEVLVTGWGAPRLDADVLRAAPNLRAVVHTAGTVKGHVTQECWRRGIVVSSAASVNAVAVAEFTLAAILFAGKRVLQASHAYREHRGARDWYAWLSEAGNYRRRVGIVGASRVGRRVIELLRPFDMDVLLSDPYADQQWAADRGVRLASLPELCASCDMVSIHAPALPSTRGLISRQLLERMPDGATVINTARGGLVDAGALEAELVSGRLNAVIDVTEPGVLPPGSPLYDLPNVLLTPHIAGSMGNELRRMTDFALDELARWVRGEPFADPVLPERWNRTA